MIVEKILQVFGFFPSLRVLGFTTLAVAVFFFGGLNLLALGIVGQYLARIYREDVPRILSETRQAIAVTVLVVVGGIIFGWLVSLRFPLPAGSIDLRVDRTLFQQQLSAPGYSFLPNLNTEGIFWNNVRSLALAALVGAFSFGSLALLLLLTPMAIVGFFAGEVANLGFNPVTFFVAFILPHGVLELPAAILATALSLRLGASVTAPPPGVSAGENLLHAFADVVKVFVFVVLPLLLIAAWVEANLTPQVVLWFYGR